MKLDLEIDFINDRVNYNRSGLKGKNELIAKAMGLSKGYREILDLTAGMAVDSVFLFKLGCRVTAIERSEPVYQMLAEAFEKARDYFSQFRGELKFAHADANQYLDQFENHQGPEVIYYDPMYPMKTKSALPKKSMQVFRQVVGDDNDCEQVLAKAILKAKYRVVVKRPLKAEPILPGVIHSFEGKIVRYDMYITQVSPPNGGEKK